ncbi:MAG: plasmid pRiA4b ORF-3 family protein [Candidatus Lokiarchaeota archaeon]|nr:plasmid pRiA4b ORF-3 family protein [Candidatus Lokiarchaeota archaeon]MBD3198533.1 plasmid pRiA4b ORF-3 family protein [Candidatus Lokiarchaeota archaeon]
MKKPSSRLNIYSNINNRNNPKPKQLYQLKITLRDIRPPIWRRILVSNQLYFADLHHIIQIYFSWGGYHLYEFYYTDPFDPSIRYYIAGKREWAESSEIEDYYHFMADEIQLCDVFSEGQKIVYYLYDFGDNWLHKIALEKKFPHKDGFDEPLCVGGKRAAPPEDSGGAGGYQEILEIKEDPSHPEYEEIKEWIGDEFDPQEITEIDVKMSPKTIENKFGPRLED